MDHFKGKSPLKHLEEARIKTQIKLKENHSVETKNSFDAFIRLMSESAMFLGLFQVFYFFHPIEPVFQLAFLGCFILFRSVYSALDGFSRLERVHRVIEEERFEIEHHENQEKEELKALYSAKGFQGPLLDDVVEVLMSDKNRLLEVMLEEELGLKLELAEHPLEQGYSALLGGVIVLFFGAIFLFYTSFFFSFILSLILVFLSAFFKARQEKISRIKTVVWHLANFILVATLFYFGLKIYISFL